MTTAEQFEVGEERLLLVHVARTLKELKSAYEAARYAWPIKRERAESCDLVLAHVGANEFGDYCRYEVVGAYRPCEWLEATRENFPSRNPHPGRWGFYGREADLADWDRYVGKLVPRHLRGNVYRYSHPE